jgi:hypothetical protein
MRQAKWSLEKLKEEALKYKTRSEFKKKNGSAYNAASKIGILGQICSHMKPLHNSWTNEKLREEALKYSTKKDFRESNESALQTAFNRGILDEICRHMVELKHKWTLEELCKESLKYKTKSELEKTNIKVYRAIINNGFGKIAFSHMPENASRYGENHYKFKWTKETVCAEATEYKLRIDFQNNSYGAYQAACRLGILDEVCSHMEYVCYPWVDEEILEEAKKYEFRTEFARKSAGAYQAAKDRDLLETACKHMKKDTASSSMEREIFNTVKPFFKTTKKLRDRKAKIEGKPHIHGFDIDIFIPELNLGIEFDGKYHHSFEYMRKDRFKSLWPDEDIRNYHEIKDAYFLSKGIKILHIKGDDWKENKEACLQKCLYFLGVTYE